MRDSFAVISRQTIEPLQLIWPASRRGKPAPVLDNVQPGGAIRQSIQFRAEFTRMFIGHQRPQLGANLQTGRHAYPSSKAVESGHITLSPEAQLSQTFRFAVRGWRSGLIPAEQNHDNHDEASDGIIDWQIPNVCILLNNINFVQNV